jgi:Zn-dependent protease with chaperone function
MSLAPLGSPVLAVLVALAPGLFYWWSARSLQRAIDDPVLPERLLNLQRRGGAILIFTIVALVGLFSIGPGFSRLWHLLWAMPLLILGRYAGAYPLRRALYDETWSLSTYLSFSLRTMAALPGFWLTLAALPFLARLAGPFDWIVGAAIGAVLLVWNARYPMILRWIFDASPIENDALIARFRAMADRCGLTTTRFEFIDLRGGAVLNAVALPSLRQPAVVFTDTMLQRLDHDETVAICAHELAHLEYYNPVRLRHLGRRTSALIGGGVIVAPLARLTGWSPLLTLAIWVMAWLAFLIALARNRQKNETESDRRAVILAGDPEALVRALTKAYAFNRFPRRLDSEFERHATHPSLARRIRDIRAAANQAPAAFAGSLTVTCTDRTVLSLDAERVNWTDPDGTTHAIPYEQVVELRFDVNNRRGPRLLVLQKSGRKWQFDIDAADVARVQQTLDSIDGHFAEPVPADQWMGMGRTLAGIGALMAMTAGMIGAALAIALAAFRPTPRFLAASGFASLTGAAMTLRDRPFEGEVLTVITLTLAGLGATWIYMATRTPALPPDRRDTLAFAGLVVCAALACLTIFFTGLDALALHQNAVAMSGGVAMIAALSGALFFTPGLVSRLLAALPALVAVAGMVAGTAAFLDRFGRDPFLAQSEPLERQIVSGQPAAEFTVPFAVSELRVSPRGERIAFATYDYEQGRAGMAFHVGKPAGPFTRIAADDVAFVDDERLLATRARMGSIEVQELLVGAPANAVWSSEIRNVFATQLLVHPRTGHWTIAGIDDEQQVVRIDGEVGRADPRETRWPVARTGVYPTAIVGSGREVLVVETDFDLGLAEGGAFSPWLWLRLFQGANPGVRWWRTGNDQPAHVGSSRLGTTCSSAGAPENHVLCSAFDGRRTRFVLIDGDSGQLTPVGWLPGRFLNFNRGAGEWTSGFAGSTVTLVNARKRQMLQFGSEQYGVGLRTTAATDEVVVGAWSQAASTTIRVFRTAGLELSAQASPGPDSAAPRRSP